MGDLQNGNPQLGEDPAALESWIRSHLAELAGVSAEQINVHKPIAAYGVDSAEAAALAEDLEAEIGREIPLDTIWEWATVRDLAERLCELVRTAA